MKEIIKSILFLILGIVIIVLFPFILIYFIAYVVIPLLATIGVS